MNPILTIEDPLADKAVTIVITLVAGGQTRDERLALVSVGVPEQPPASRSGRFAALPDLIDAAWTAYGVQAQTAVAVSSDEVDEELVAEEEVEAVPTPPTAVPVPPPAVPVPPPAVPVPPPAVPVPPPPPRPQAHNLSLF